MLTYTDSGGRLQCNLAAYPTSPIQFRDGRAKFSGGGTVRYVMNFGEVAFSDTGPPEFE